jgi:hypothetical protein
MLKLEQEIGEMLLSRYGNIYALAFKGNPDFIERSYNFAFNFGVTNGSLIELTQDMSYVLSSQEKILKALKLYFYGEVIREKLVRVDFDEDYNISIDEIAAENLAAEKAQTFFDNKIQKENFMFNKYLDKIKRE